jgi:hypothetical protein
MLRTLLFSAGLLGGLGTSPEVQAKTRDVPVTLAVQDPTGAPIPTAHIRHPEEALLHDVNHETGRWSASAIYLEDGTRVAFENKQDLTFEISAPGYQSSLVQFRLRKRLNQVRVTLVPIDFTTDPEAEDEPFISFHRSIPID